jgi:hypothetical protein
LTNQSLHSLLLTKFPTKHVEALTKHYSGAVDALQHGHWQLSITRTGQFIEAALKSLWVHTGGQLPPARQFKAGKVAQDLKQLPAGTFSDAIRITIPRACEFVYDIASNRGSRHDPDEVDPNEIDAHIACNAVSWILAEMTRYAQRGAGRSSDLASLLASLVQTRYPVVEEVEGRTYFHFAGVSARQLAVLRLWHSHPHRVTRREIIDTLERHHVSRNNARTALNRIATVVDETVDGLRLLAPGIAEAENLVRTANEERKR